MVCLGLSLPSPGQLLSQEAFKQHFQNTIQNRTQKLIKNVTKMGAKTGKGWPKKAAKRGQEEDMSPRGSEACPNSPQDSPTRAPREPKESPKRAPRELQESPKRAPKGPKAPQEDHKRVTREPARANLQASSPPVASAGVAKRLQFCGGPKLASRQVKSAWESVRLPLYIVCLLVT